MPMFEIQQYELYTCTYRVRANSAAEAIHKLWDGEGTQVEDSEEYIEVDEEHGIPCDDNRDIVKGLEKLHYHIPESHISGIAGIEEIEESE